MVRENDDQISRCAMELTKYLKIGAGINTAKLALWAALIALALVAGIAALGSGPI